MTYHLSYSQNGLNSTAWLTGALRARVQGVKFDTIVGTGISGALVVPTLGRAMRKQWALIRKDGDSPHADPDCRFEGKIGKRFIIADDWVDSGRTVSRILDTIRTSLRRYDPNVPLPAFLGVWEYAPRGTVWRSADNVRSRWRTIDDALTAYGVPAPVIETMPCPCECGTRIPVTS